MIKINSLNKYFNKGKQNEIHVINDISLELPSNGMVAIFGKSGCGKTTLLNTIGGLDNFKSGNISIDENDITRIVLSKLEKENLEKYDFIVVDSL